MAKSTTTPSPRKRTSKKKEVDTAPLAASDVDPTQDDIRLRAYERYLERGGEHGADFDDWLEAEKDLRSPRHN